MSRAALRRLRSLEEKLARARASPRDRTPEGEAERQRRLEDLFGQLDAEYRALGLEPPERDEPVEPADSVGELTALFGHLDGERRRLIEKGLPTDD